MEELKPCPFCGCEAIPLDEIITNGKYYGVFCMNCTARVFSYVSQESADEQWNRRVNDD